MKNIFKQYADKYCPFGNNCAENGYNVLNLIIFENEEKILFYNLQEKRIFLIKIGKGLFEIDFKRAIREIDIIPTKEPEWKRIQILKLAKELGFFGIN